MTEKTGDSLAAALEREHREIDEGIERFTAQPVSIAGQVSLAGAIGALRRHIYLEEEFVFPALRADEDPGMVAPIFVMLREHAQIWRTLDDLERELGAGTSGESQACHQLLVQLQHHNMKEERILYPLADRTPPRSTVARITEVMQAGQMPRDWICMKARD